MSEDDKTLAELGAQLVADPHSPLLERDLRRLRWRIAKQHCRLGCHAFGRMLVTALEEVRANPPFATRKLP